MAIPAELSPDLMDTSGLNQILTTQFDPAYGQQLQQWGLPVRSAMNHARRQNQDVLDAILAQNQGANAMRYDLAQRQLAQDQLKEQYGLAGTIASALSDTNEQGIGQLIPVQDITADGGAGLDAILGSGDLVNRSKVLAEAAKAQAEAEAAPIEAEAKMLDAKSGGANRPNFNYRFAPDGSLEGYDYKTNEMLDPSTFRPNKSQGNFDEEQSSEIKSPTGDRLIPNSDGSATLIRSDGSKEHFTKEQVDAARQRNARQ